MELPALHWFLLAFEVPVVAGALWWTFRRALLPVGALGSAALALIIAIAQALLASVVHVGLEAPPFDAALRTLARGPIHGAALALGALALIFAVPFALQRFLRLDRAGTRALSREFLTGFIASAMIAMVVTAMLLVGVGLLYVAAR